MGQRPDADWVTVFETADTVMCAIAETTLHDAGIAYRTIAAGPDVRRIQVAPAQQPEAVIVLDDLPGPDPGEDDDSADSPWNQ